MRRPPVCVCVNGWNWFWLRILPRPDHSIEWREQAGVEPQEIVWKKKPYTIRTARYFMGATAAFTYTSPPVIHKRLPPSHPATHSIPNSAPLSHWQLCASIHFNNKFQQINQNVTEAVWNFQVAGATAASQTPYPPQNHPQPPRTTRSATP